MTTVHCTSDQLHQYVDGRLTGEGREEVQRHVLVCSQCSNALVALQRLDTSLRRVPLARVSPEFTQSVISRLHLAPTSPLTFRILEKAAYLFGLSIVLAIMLAAFVVTGVVDMGAVDQTQNSVQESLSAIGGSVGSVVGSFSAWLKAYFPFAYAQGALSIAFFGSLILGALALVDRLLVRRFVHRV